MMKCATHDGYIYAISTLMHRAIGIPRGALPGSAGSTSSDYLGSGLRARRHARRRRASPDARTARRCTAARTEASEPMTRIFSLARVTAV